MSVIVVFMGCISVDIPQADIQTQEPDQNTEARIYVRGDRDVAYGRVMEIMSIINSAGYVKVALVAQSNWINEFSSSKKK